MSVLYNFPVNAAFGRVLPKKKVYEHAAPGARVKELFVREVEKIIWSYKLSPGTINLPARDGVEEIQIFTIVLKNGTLSHNVLQVIDKAIPSPILFVLHTGKHLRYAAAYKRPSEADRSKWVVSRYFETDWLHEDTARVELPMVLNLEVLYHTLLKNIIPFPARKQETIAAFVERVEQIQSKERELVKVQALLQKERQFNRRVATNAELKQLKQEIEALASRESAG